MMVDVVSLIRNRRAQRLTGIEELARKLADGAAIAPEDIEAALDEAGATEEQLQERIDALVKRSQLIAHISAGDRSEKRLAKIDEEKSAAWAAFATAQQAHAAVVARYAEEVIELQRKIDVANDAREGLLSPELLSPADRERLDAARKASSQAIVRAEEAKRAIPDAKASLEEAERYHADAQEVAKRRRDDPEAKDHVERSGNAVNARGARLRDLEQSVPKLQAEAQRLAADLQKLEDELRETK